MPQGRSPEEPVASGMHRWLESGAVEWRGGGEGNQKDEGQGQSMKHTKRTVRSKESKDKR